MDRLDRQTGSPADLARLQQDDQADITTPKAIDDGLVRDWLDDPELAVERERLQRLQADEELLLALQLSDFNSREWARFSRELSRYGLGVLQAWIKHGTIYGKVMALTGYSLSRIESWPDPETIGDLATDTIVAALEYFRDKVLRTNRWQSSGGASLGTFFIGQCLYQFANIYRSSLRAELERIKQATTPVADPAKYIHDVIRGIEDTIVTRDAVAEAMAQLTTDRARRALFLQEFGYSQSEIAEELGLPGGAKAVENLIGYQHSLIRRRIAGRTP